MFQNILTKITSKLNLSPTKKKVAKNVYWAFLGKIVNMAAALFVGIIVARYLGPSQYGLMNYVISYVAIFEVISEFGLSNIEIRELSHHPDKKERILGSAFAIRLVFTISAYILLALSLLAFTQEPFTVKMILVYGLYMFTKCFTIIRNYFTSIILNEYVVKAEITRTLLGAAIKIVLLLLHAPLSAFIIATAFDGVIVASGYVYCYNKKVGLLRNWTYNKDEAKYLGKEGFPLLLSSAAIIVYNKIDQVMIGNMLNHAEVGYYATAEKFLSLILFLPTVLVQTVAPLLVKKYNEDPEGYLKMRQQFVNVVTWSAALIALVICLSSYVLIRFTYGVDYLAAVPVLAIMSWKTVGNALSSSGGQIIILEKKQKWAVIRNIVGCAVNVGLNLWLIPLWGILGSAWTSIITIFVSGWLCNLLIPPYRHVFSVQTKAIFMGWKDLTKIKKIIRGV